jgi:hypothetical protein
MIIVKRTAPVSATLAAAALIRCSGSAYVTGELPASYDAAAALAAGAALLADGVAPEGLATGAEEQAESVTVATAVTKRHLARI